MYRVDSIEHYYSIPMMCQENIPVGHMDLIPAKSKHNFVIQESKHKLAGGYTLFYPFSPVSSSSGYHSDGVVRAALEVSEDGLSCCWVTEVYKRLTTSHRMVGHSGAIEAVRSWT